MKKEESKDNNINIESMLRAVPAIKEDMSSKSVLDLFHKDKQLYSLPVVTDKLKPVGMVVRQVITETFSKPYFKELVGEKPISAMMNHDPIIVDHNASVEDVARIILDAGIQHMVSGFIITRDAKYLGMGNGYDLINEIINYRQKHLFDLAHFDQLTGLPNRTLLLDRLSQAISISSRSNHKISLLFIDLDGFKQVNDTFGHSIGDCLLKEVGKRLLGCIREGDTVARLGGDEFVVSLLESNLTRAIMVTERILEKLRQPYDFGLNEDITSISGSIGIAEYPDNAGNRDDLLDTADKAMYVAKKRGKNQFAVFDSTNSN
jgi:diguanylate cyclase (GGDEF)-like protein